MERISGEGERGDKETQRQGDTESAAKNLLLVALSP
jgi:hypothetical protein